MKDELKSLLVGMLAFVGAGGVLWAWYTWPAAGAACAGRTASPGPPPGGL